MLHDLTISFPSEVTRLERQVEAERDWTATQRIAAVAEMLKAVKALAAAGGRSAGQLEYHRLRAAVAAAHEGVYRETCRRYNRPRMICNSLIGSPGSQSVPGELRADWRPGRRSSGAVRTTLDIDLLVAASQMELPRLLESLQAEAFDLDVYRQPSVVSAGHTDHSKIGHRYRS